MTVCSLAHRRKRKMGSKIKFQAFGDHDEFLNRITKTLYYGKHPVIDRFSLPVSELASELFSEVKKGCSLDRLHVDEAAEISRNACVSPCSLVLALLYLERLKTCNSEYMKRVGPSELFLVSCMVASKFLHDEGAEDEVFNDEWATSGGIDLKDMNRLEREFLNAINWEVYVSEQSFWTKLNRMETMLALREGKRRGWFSYTELAQLVHIAELFSLAHTLVTVSAICLTSYTASVLAMVGSTILVNQVPATASSLISATLTPHTPSTMIAPLPTASITPETCITNETLLDDIPIRLNFKDWNEIDENNHSFLSEKIESPTGMNRHHETTWREWPEQKDWLTTIIQLIEIGSSTSPPNKAIPLDILMY